MNKPNLLTRFAGEVSVNRVVQFLTYSDILRFSGWGLIAPILAVFVTDQVVGGDVQLAGLTAAAFYVVKSIIQVPVARWIDSRKGEWDDFWVMIVGSLLITLSAFMFIWIRYPWEVYVAQIINGFGSALSYPPWAAIFTRHIDRDQEGLEWSLYYTAVDLGTALTAGLGGFMAGAFGYKSVFVLVGITSLASTLFLTGITGSLRKRSV